jgi:SAM-dependent methyltransferase
MNGIRRLPQLAYAIARIAIPGGRWSYRGSGYCPSCDRTTLFALSESHVRWINELTREWDSSALFKRSLAVRESLICVLCRANIRVRLLAQTVLDKVGVRDTSALVKHMQGDRSFSIYETASRNVFRDDRLLSLSNYVTSEYIDNARPGEIVDGVLNQDLERLTFANDTFDIVITSEVLEHVADLDRALAEIRRVLKAGGFHIFTVPLDPDLHRSGERARMADGKIVHMKPAVHHGDSRRAEGILAFRDFGSDAVTYLGRPGMKCEEIRFHENDEYLSSALVAKKLA